MLPLAKAIAKLGYVASSIFVGLLEQGFCTAKEEGDADGGGAGERGSFQEAEGTVRLHVSGMFWAKGLFRVYGERGGFEAVDGTVRSHVSGLIRGFIIYPGSETRRMTFEAPLGAVPVRSVMRMFCG